MLELISLGNHWSCLSLSHPEDQLIQSYKLCLNTMCQVLSSTLKTQRHKRNSSLHPEENVLRAKSPVQKEAGLMTSHCLDSGKQESSAFHAEGRKISISDR